jgi:glycerol-3-phosphate O-acyltransferase / dihydroxyacetone phosphate acyltransferase
MRRFFTAVLRVVARIFFRRIEIVGEERVPRETPVIFAVNHPNALIDPLFLLCFAPRPVSFLAKAPLFRMPFVSMFVKAFESIPVYRREDNFSPEQNRETFARSRETLARGGAIAIFPEGTTHSESRLKSLKTGAARIALGSELPRVLVIPTGLFYTSKQTFRSAAVMYLGAPIEVQPVAVDDAGEPPREAVESLTKRIEAALDEVTVQADSRAALDLIGRADRIFRLGRGDLAEALETRKRFVAGYRWLCENDPERLARVQSRIERFESELGAANLEPKELVPPTFLGSVKTILTLLVMLPLALAGAVIHYPIYRLIGALVTRVGSDEELIATQKAVGGLVLYPLTWLAVAGVVWWRFGWEWAIAALVVVPILGYIALRFGEQLDGVVGRARAITWRVARRRAYARLLAQQRAIRDEIVALNDEILALNDVMERSGPASASSAAATRSSPPR